MYDDLGFYLGDGGGLDALYSGGWDYPVMDSYDSPSVLETPGISPYSLWGDSPSNEQMLQQAAMGDPSAVGTPVSLGVADFNGDPMRELMVNAAQGFTPIGRLNDDGSIDSFGRSTNAFGGSLPRLMDALKGLGRMLPRGGGDGGGGGGGVGMPKIDSPVAERIGALPVPALRDAPQAAPFTPLQIPNAGPRGEEMDLRSLARLIRGAR